MTNPLEQLEHIKFYPREWQRSAAIQSLSFHDKGFYIELRCMLMCSTRGMLLSANGKASSDAEVARLLAMDVTEFKSSLDRLMKAGLLQRDSLSGAIMCREIIHALRRFRNGLAYGARGGNPGLKKRGRQRASVQPEPAVIEQAPPPPPAPVAPPPPAVPSQPDFKLDVDQPKLPPFPVPSKKDILREKAVVALKYLNEAAGRNFRDTDDKIRMIMRRLEEVAGDIVGVKVMIDRQCALWKGDPKMEIYLRPETLFAGKFNSYYDDRHLPIPRLVRVGHHAPPEQNQLRENIATNEIKL